MFHINFIHIFLLSKLISKLKLVSIFRIGKINILNIINIILSWYYFL